MLVTLGRYLLICQMAIKSIYLLPIKVEYLSSKVERVYLLTLNYLYFIRVSAKRSDLIFLFLLRQFLQSVYTS